jgi:gluconolactonase
MLVKSDGSIWFINSPFGILGNCEGHKAEPELPQAVCRIGIPSRECQRRMTLNNAMSI